MSGKGGAGSSIPELLGFPAIPYERNKLYSVKSYQAHYLLTEEEAIQVRKTYDSHPEVDMHLSQRYIGDAEYRERVEKAREDLTASEPDLEVKRLMRRLMADLTAPSTEAKKAVDDAVGVLPEDKGGAA